MKKVFLALLTVLALGTLAACGGDPDPESIELDESSVEIDVGESVTVSATVEPEDADQDVEWSSDDTSVATVDDGEITGVAEGSATITATSTVDEDITASVDVTVEEEEDDPSGDDDDPESISLSEEDLELEVGEQLLIEATVEPEEAEQDVEWSSDDEDVAEISGGVLEAIGEGEATITATSTEDDSVSASITVTVIEPLIDIADVVAMDDGEDDLFIEGVVTALTSHSTFFVEDSTGAIAVYDSDSSNDGPDGEFISEVAVGDRVRLTGEKGSYEGLNQLVPDSVEVLESDVDLPDPVNLDEAIQDEIDSINADIEEENAELEEGETEEDLVDRLTQDEFEELLAAYQGRRVSMSEYVVSNIDEDQYGTFNVDLVGFNDGHSIPFRYDNRLPIEDDDMLYSLEETDVIDVESMVLGWHENPQLLYTGEGDYAETDMGEESLDAYRVDTYLTAESSIAWAENVADDMGDTFTFESLDEDVATVDSDGVITGEGKGATLVQVKDDDGDVFSNVFVVVHGLDVQVNDSLNDDGELLVRTDEEFELDYSVLPEEMVSQDVTVTSDDDSVVSVDDSDGVTLTGEDEGTATLTITSANDPDATMELDVLVENSVPELDFIAEYQVYEDDEAYDDYGSADEYILRDATASDYMDGDLTGDISVVDDDGFDIGETGTYEIDIEVTNSFGEKAEATITIEVVEEGEVIAASGTYNFKYVDSEIRHTLFAAAERYLMETVYGGVPSTINAGYALYSERTQLPVEDPVPVMDYGTMFGDFSDYDDEVVMDDGNPGEDDEKTWRAAETNDPGQYNHWEYDDSISADFLTLMQDSLYYFDFNDDKTGYEVLPSMADGMPTPVDDYENDFGVTLSDEWHVSIRDDLEWYFHDETLDEYSDLSNGDEIDAQQFIDTYKLALDNEWFRAISGGGDFTTAPQKIKNAQEYADGEEGVEWEDVGLKVEDGDLVFEFEEDIDEWGVIYWLSSFVTTPINLELYDLLEADGETYGVSEETTAYHGPYYLDYYEADKVLRFKENPNFHSPDRYNFTGHTYQIIEDSDIRFQEFLNGNLDAVEVPSTQYESYQNDPRIKAIPGATTFRASINSLGTVEAQQEQFGEGSDFEPEPLLAWEGDEATFRNALYHAWDRETIADSVQVTNEPAMYYFSEAYLVAPQEGVSFREWDNLEANRREYIDTLDSEDDFDQDDFDDWLDENRDPDASIVGEGLGTDTLGYNPDLARAIFRDAMDDLVDDGEYELGTPDDPLEIELQFTIQSGSSAQTAYAEFMKDELEEIFDYQNDDGETLAYVTLDIDPVEFPDNYYTRILVGQTDMGMGGISGSTLDAASFLDVFCDDNRGGFTMDWGIDTSSANIEVTYENETGTEVTELWSYNALVSALNQTTRVSNGEEAE